jgi:WhiB family redox-sensing transcriptional regulator
MTQVGPVPDRTLDLNELGFMSHANCQGAPSAVMFPANGRVTRQGRRLCGACVVREECLAYALRHREVRGTWGGLGEAERSRLVNL